MHMRRSTARLLLCLQAIIAPSAIFAAEPALMPKASIYFEDSPAAGELLQAAKDLRDQGRLADAADRYQTALEQFPAKVTLASPNIYRDVWQTVVTELASDPALLQAYRRNYEPAARAALDRAGEGLDGDVAALAALTRRYPLTSAAFEAGCRRAAVLLERAEPNEAQSALLEIASHPDLSENADRYRLLVAAVALAQNDPAAAALVEAATAAPSLQQPETRELLATIKSWRSSEASSASTTQPSQSPSQPWNVTTTLPSPAWPALWQVVLPSAQNQPDRNDPAQAAALANRGEQPSSVIPWSPVIPSAYGDTIFINDGQAMLALDRSSGRTLWIYRPADNVSPTDMVMPFNRSMMSTPDPRSVLVSSDRAIGVIGHATEWRMRFQGAETGNALVCVDAITGKPLWQLRPGEIDPLLANAYFHGSPLSDPGGTRRVYVALRRTQVSGFGDSFLAAIDLSTGKPVWKRHLGSSVNTNSPRSSSLSRMMQVGHRLIVADPSGVVACVEGATGTIHWMTVLSEAQNGEASPYQGPRSPSPADFQVGAPVLVEAGLLVPAMRAGWPAVLIDPADGKRLRDVRGAMWPANLAAPPLLCAAPGGVLTIGSSATLFDGKTLEVRWTAPLGKATPRLSPQGRPAITARHIVVPCQDRIVVLSTADGSIEAELLGPPSGNVLAMDHELIIATSSSVLGCMTWDQAYARLSRQITQSPTDAQPALALAHVALSAKRPDALIQAVDAALLATRQRLDAPEVFPQLVRIAESASLDLPTRQTVFDRLAQAMRTPEDQVTYHLALGQFFAQAGRAAEAVEQYQTILGQSQLATTIYRGPSGSKQAGIEALVRLTQAVKDAGPSSYDRFDAIAAMRLKEIAPSDVPSLLELSKQYPLSRSAPLAVTMAAERMATEGNYAGAMLALRTAYRSPGASTLLSRIVGSAVETCEKRKQPRAARQWLVRAKRDHPTLEPLRAGQPVSIDQWLSLLNDTYAGAAALPTLNLPLREATVVPGRLLLPSEQPRAMWLRDRMLTLTGDKVRCTRAADLTTEWETKIAGQGVRLLWHSEEQVLLWITGSATLLSLDPATGKTNWSATDLRATLEDVGSPQQRAKARSLEQRRFLEMANNAPMIVRNGRVEMAVKDDAKPTIMLGVNESTICIADSVGRMLGVDRVTGQVRWREMASVDRLSKMVMDDETIVASGVDGLRTESQSQTLIVLDAATGQRRYPTIEEDDALSWIGLGGDGLLLSATPSQVTARSAVRGDVTWRCALPASTPFSQASLGGDHLLVQAGGVMHSIDLSNGQVVKQFTGLPREITSQPPKLTAVEGSWHALAPTFAAVFSEEGSLQWRDGLIESDKALVAQAASERLMIAVSFAGPDPAMRQAAIRAAMDAMAGAGAPGVVMLPGVPGVVGGPMPVAPQMEARFNAELADARRARLRNGPPVQPEGPSIYRLYLFDRVTGSLLDQSTLATIPEAVRPECVTVLDDRLLLGTANATVVIRGTISKGK